MQLSIYVICLSFKDVVILAIIIFSFRQCLPLKANASKGFKTVTLAEFLPLATSYFQLILIPLTKYLFKE